MLIINYVYIIITLMICGGSLIVKTYELRAISSKYALSSSLSSMNDDGNDDDDDDDDSNDRYFSDGKNDIVTTNSNGKSTNQLTPFSVPYTTNSDDNYIVGKHSINPSSVNGDSVGGAGGGGGTSSIDERNQSIESYILAYINYTYINYVGKLVEFSEEKGKYGEGKVLNVFGVLVHITNKDDITNHSGCTTNLSGTNGDRLPVPPQKWIALMQRGHCNFEDKVRHAYLQNAIGVIIYNDRESGTLDKMRIRDHERNITAIFTHKWLGEQLAAIVEDGHELNISISEGRQVKPMANINRTSVLFVSISFIVLMIISLIWLIFYYVQRFRYLQTKDRKSRQMCSVAKRIISKIPTKSIKSEDKEIENDCCAICIEPYKVTDIIRMLPCRHDFHKCCIDPWLLEHRTCPMCKMDILKHYGFVFTGSQESILQLEMDIEDGEDNNDSVSSDRIDGVNNERIHARSVSPTYIIQLDHEHLRRTSVESVISVQRDGSSPQVCILNGINGNAATSSCSVDLNSDGTTNSATNKIKIKCGGCVSISKDQSSIGGGDSSNGDNNLRKEKIHTSISLPCTLKKCKGMENCNHHNSCNDGRGGCNNCYVWTLDFQQLNKKIDLYEKGHPKLKGNCCVNATGNNNNNYNNDIDNIDYNNNSTKYHKSNTNENIVIDKRRAGVTTDSDCSSSTVNDTIVIAEEFINLEDNGNKSDDESIIRDNK